jgi:hypothetical protein
MPPYKAIEGWVEKKNIRFKKNRRYLPQSTVVFMITRSIFNKGIIKTLFFTNPISRSEKRLNDGVEKSLTVDIENNIKNALK